MTATQIWWTLGLSVVAAIIVGVGSRVGLSIFGGVRKVRRILLQAELGIVRSVKSAGPGAVQLHMLRATNEILIGLGFMIGGVFIEGMRPVGLEHTNQLAVQNMNLVISIVAGGVLGNGIGMIWTGSLQASIIWSALTRAEERERTLEAKIKRLS